MLKYKRGDKVKTLKEITCIAGKIPENSEVVVTAVDPIFKCYDIRYDDTEQNLSLDILDCAETDLTDKDVQS